MVEWYENVSNFTGTCGNFLTFRKAVVPTKTGLRVAKDVNGKLQEVQKLEDPVVQHTGILALWKGKIEVYPPAKWRGNNWIFVTVDGSYLGY